ncbi:EAL domain-containing protein [Marinobacterium arenosum]|uniref:EAL domain-containing protein n=1 Tax=Marinobacterium arenosum TaxID=2862496 RepID=UPI001C938C83|nr:EAL domain-containing protein [Marinobacterium arenosum]MBY4677459.1 EAL domain-containing protein [Marinobacterium arenosum]
MTALGYLVTGALGLSLAIPPGFATVIWPPSGIALAAVLLLGDRALLGVWLGSFLLNLFVAAGGELSAIGSPVTPALIGLGAALQAKLAATLVRRSVGFPFPIHRTRESLRCLLLGGPLSCLFNATMGTGVLYWQGIVTSANYWDQWLTWWVGDTIGVVVMTPLLLLFFAPPRNLWWPRVRTVGLPLALILAIGMALFLLGDEKEKSHQAELFAEHSALLQDSLQEKVDATVDSLYALRGYIRATDNPTPEGFATFSEELLQRSPHLFAVSWNCWVPHAQRAEFERQMARRYDQPDFSIRQKKPEGGLKVADPADHYLVVSLVEPMATNRAALGFDVYYDPIRRSTIDQAIRTGRAIPTEKISLIQNHGSRDGMLIFLPVAQQADSLQQSAGMVVAVLVFDELVAPVIADHRMPGSEVALIDPRAQRKVLYRSEQAISDEQLLAALDRAEYPLQQQREIRIDGHRWLLVQYAPHELLSLAWDSYFLMAAGFLFTGLLSWLLLVIAGRTTEVEEEVSERTHQLSVLNHLLAESQRLAELGSWRWNLADDTHHWSAQMYQLLGLSPEEQTASRELFFSHVRPEAQALVREGFERARQNMQTVSDLCCPLVGSTSRESGRLLRINIEPAGDANRPALTIVAQDVTEQQAVEDALRRNESRFRALVEDVNAVGWEYDVRADRFTYVSPHSQKMLGYPAEAWGTLSAWAEMIHPDDRDQAVHFCTIETAQGRSHTFEYRMLTIDGRVIWVRDAVTVICDDEGRPSHLVGVLTDIDTLKAQSEVLAEQRRTFEALLDNAPIGIWLTDRNGRARFVNQTFCNALGIDEQTFLEAEHYVVPLGEETAQRFRESDTACLAQQAPHRSTETLTFDDGELHTLELTKVTLRNDDGEVVGLIGLANDVTSRLKAEEWQRQAAVVFDHSREGVIVTDAEQRIQAVNRAFCDITGYTEEEVRGRRPGILKSGRHDHDYYRRMWQSIDGQGSWQGEIWNRRKDSELYPAWLTIAAVRDERQNLQNYVAVFSDISQIKESQRELEHLAHHDLLTGLPNRVLFNDRLEHAMARADRSGERLGLLFLDLDHFKNINDSLGHETGDLLLRQVAERIRTTLRQSDTVARLGGDEFAILLEEMGEADEAGRLAELLIKRIASGYQVEGRELFVGTSIGLAFYPQDGIGRTELLRNADAAMYRAKAAGRNTYHCYTRQMTDDAYRHVQLESELRRAIEQQQLELYYQPQFSMDGSRLSGLEALVRWRHPDLGMILPGHFIPLAEESDLIVALGELVLHKACRQGRQWLDQGLEFGRISVNLSRAHMLRANILQLVEQVLAGSGLPAERLELEITESFFLDHRDQAYELLHSIRQLGVTLAIDDFGTGYSSMSYLKQLPVQKLKIDRAFVQALPDDADDAAIARAIIALGHSLKFTVIAEGVETEAQQAFLMAAGCDQLQGYLYGTPQPPAEIEVRWLASAELRCPV